MSPAARRRPPLGQHFLADENILRVIERLARLEPSDVVLEIGAGHGALTRFLAERVGQVHAVELDRTLEPELTAIAAAAGNVSLHVGDALRLEVTALRPVAGKLVSNLPYSIATPVIVESVVHAPSIRSWCVMVQREVADRLFAAPSTKAYGAVSVVVQLGARRTGFHPVSRHVFRPPPRVESALVAFERVTPPARLDEIQAAVEAAFAHRRKTLANSLALTGYASRERAATALAEIGLARGVRAEALAPADFVLLAEALRRC
jgi:16S rRNA (adenine1518-N6/adenine1519-N6)-dimethyltransferase